MKTRTWKFLTVSLLLAAVHVQAIDFVQTNRFAVSETNSIANETWLSAQTVRIDGSISNDLFATATDMELNGRFHGDVWGLADHITGAGIFHNSTRLFSRTTTQIMGTHYGSVMAAGTTVKIDRSAVLYDDLFCLGENIIIEGSVSGDTRVIGQRVTIGGQFKNNISLAAQEIVVLPGTLINGDLTYTAPEELVLPSSVLLSGELTRKIPTAAPRTLLKENLLAHFMFALAALVTGLVFCGLFPRYTGTALHLLREARGTCLLAGFAGLVVLPMTSFFIFLTIIGIPLSILIFLSYLILLYLSKLTAALWIGSMILRKNAFNKRNTAPSLTLGLLVIYALTSITAIEMVVNVVVIILGLGALLIAFFKNPVLILQTPDAMKEINEGE